MPSTTFPLKYGFNPHQASASYTFPGRPPFKVLNGRVGTINLMDALNSWQLVRELREAVGLPAAASFKHVSPAGAAVSVPLSEKLLRGYGFAGSELSPLACAYLRARGADPASSFGDFIALSDVVDEATARILALVVSDGVIAPGYEPAALEALKAKKKGEFIVLEADPGYEPPTEEEREVYGVRLRQARNNLKITRAHLEPRVSQNRELPESAVRDLLVGLITLKYTQSNSTGYARDGQMIGVGAGQQSRVDCTKLAGRKADLWFLRQHDKVLGLQFKKEVKRQERINWSQRYVEGDMTEMEAREFAAQLDGAAPPLSAEEKAGWLGRLRDVSFASDAFLPFRDNVDHAARHGVRYIAHTGGSLRDEEVTRAGDEYGMVMIHTGVRLFHH